jgi:DNA ligase-associated metallophosphoesterase
MEKSILTKIGEETFVFDCRRTIYWPERKILLAADLHWGKTQYLRNYGVAITDRVFEEDLMRLSRVMDDYETETLLILGDLIHHEKSLSKGIIEKVASFRHHNPCELILVKGNHDRYTDFPESWGIVEEVDFYIGDYYFSHELNKKVKAFQFSGHVHPMLRLSSGIDSLRLPSFILGEKYCLLPAYSHLTGGQDIKLLKGQSALVVMEDGLEEFKK